MTAALDAVQGHSPDAGQQIDGAYFELGSHTELAVGLSDFPAGVSDDLKRAEGALDELNALLTGGQSSRPLEAYIDQARQSLTAIPDTCSWYGLSEKPTTTTTTTTAS